MCILSAYCNKQTCSPPPWNAQSLAGYYPSTLRPWKGAFVSQRAGPPDSAALYLLSSGQRRRLFISVWVGSPGSTQAWGEGAITTVYMNWQSAYLFCPSEVFIFFAVILCRFWILPLVNKCLKSKGFRFEHVRHTGRLQDVAPHPLEHPGVWASHPSENLVNTRLPKEVIMLSPAQGTDYVLKCCRVKLTHQNFSFRCRVSFLVVYWPPILFKSWWSEGKNSK